MPKMMSEPRVVAKLAEEVAQRLAKAVKSDLDELEGGLSGDDSGLETVWEELCVQVQGEESFAWDEYENIAFDAIEKHVENLMDHESAAIWYQTDEGTEWMFDEEDDRAPDPDTKDAVVEYVLRAVYTLAGSEDRKNVFNYVYGITDSDEDTEDDEEDSDQE
jgi:hypothetical protein